MDGAYASKIRNWILIKIVRVIIKISEWEKLINRYAFREDFRGKLNDRIINDKEMWINY